LLGEGLAMLLALAEDFSAIAGTRISLLWDARLKLPQSLEQMANGRVVLIHSTGEHDAQLRKVAASAERALLVAPEFDGHLSRVCRLADEVGARLLSPSRDFIDVTSDKQRTADLLAQRGVAVPVGVPIATGEGLPQAFPYPAVLKPRDGAGSQGMSLFAQHPGDDFRAPAAMRLEKFVAGQPASIAALCGPGGNLMLPPCSQRLSDDGRFAYLGGETPLSPILVERAQRLANATLEALPPAHGYVGIDLVLGDGPTNDVVIEVNPRLTTSYVGLRRLVRENLAAAMLQAADGHPPVLSLRPGRLEFNAAGEVHWIE
jgi:predicted ATP-grasp superfamily ATP-dependent carboligase